MIGLDNDADVVAMIDYDVMLALFLLCVSIQQ